MKLSAPGFLILLIWAVCSYSGYHAHAQENVAVKFPFRPYEVYGVAQKVVDKWIIDNYYKKKFYPIDTAYVSKTDTSVECDSLTFFFDRETKKIASLFTQGIISCNYLKSVYSSLPIKVNEKSLMPIDEGKKRTFIWRVELLDSINSEKKQTIIKFRVYPRTIYYAELTNENAHKHTSLKNFIKNARLTWLFKSPQYVPNM